MQSNRDFDAATAQNDLCQYAERFEAAWTHDPPPAIDDFLPGDANLRLDVLVDLVHIDLERRLARGEVVETAHYLERYTELATDPAIVIDLVAGEFRARKARNPNLTATDFAARFPEYRDELVKRLTAGYRPRRRGAIRLNCPHCHSPIEVGRQAAVEEILCPSCGSSFRIDTDRTQTWNCEHLPKLGKFELIRPVGRGAFGTVYRARDTQLERIVAVKVPRSGRLATDEDEDRFVREARNAAQLQHPGIVPVYEVGRSDAFPFIVAEFVEGITLSDALSARKFSFRESARLAAQVADALEHAHTQGVVHRDLKPSNIMLTADDTPRVMDFGLAKRDAGDVTMTIEGQVLGTPAYMSPEQASGRAHHVDGRSDVYSLGGILYELVTGELPFRGNQRMILHQVIHDEPRSLRSLNDRVPRDLETICAKAMAKEPSRRYQTAREMAEDLRRFLAGEPILARPVGQLERSWRWCRRNPLIAGLSAAVLVALVAGTTVSSMFALEARRRAAEALEQQARADAKAEEAKASAARALQQEANANHEAQRATREAEAANAATEFMTGIFQTSDSVGLAGLGLRREGEAPGQLTLQQVLRRGSERIRMELKGQPLLQARLMSTIGNIHRSLGFYQEAEPLLKESLAIRERELAGSSDRNDQLALADSQFNLAWLLHDLGDYAAAEPLYRQTLATRSALFAETHSLVTTTKFNLAWLLVDLNQQAEAERLFKEVLNTRRKSLPAGHRDVYLAEMGLAATLWTQGKHAEIIKQTLPTLSADVLLKVVSLYELARVQRQFRNYEAAARLYESILKTGREVLPPQHPLLAAVLVDMAGLLKDKGDYPAAERSMREALQIVRATMGGHPRLIEPLREFGIQLCVRGDFNEAEQLFRESLRISLQRHPAVKNEHIDIMCRVGDMLRLRGRHDAARAIFEESLQVKPDRHDPIYRETLYFLARTYFESGDWSRAQDLFQERLSDPVERENAGLRLELRECLLELGQLDAARQLFVEAQKLLAAIDPKSAHSPDTLRATAENFVAVGRGETSSAFARELIRWDVKRWPPEHPEIVRDRSLLARGLLQSRDESAPQNAGPSAMAEVEKLLAENERSCRRLGDDHPWVAQNALAKAELAAARGDMSAAAALGQEAVRILAARFPEDHPWLLKARHEAALYERRAGNLPAAVISLREVLEVRQRALPPLHADIFETKLDLAATLKAMGEAATAEANLREMLDQVKPKVAPDSRRIARAEAVLGSALLAQRKFVEAEQVLAHSHAVLAAIYGESDARVRQVVHDQAALYEAWGKPDRADEFRRRLSTTGNAN